MVWPIPQYSRSQVNKAGRILVKLIDSATSFIDLKEFEWAFEVVNNWRSCHGYPINTFQATLRNKLKSIDSGAIVAQRLKRMPSIVLKLRRFESMELARMQDIGGLRAVVSSLNEVYLLADNYESSRFNHKLVTSHDYISSPKKSGYRSLHLVYRYSNPRSPKYDSLFLELQIRTKLQHAWATAVETMGTFLNHALKSSEGPEAWLDFFSLTGSAFAYLEETSPVPGYESLTKEETFTKVVEKAYDLGIKEKLLAFSIAAEQVHTDKKSGSYHLIVLYLNEKKVTISTYSQSNLDAASQGYAEAERRMTDGEPIQAVLVSAGPIENLRRAYPNYFLDTQEFVNQLSLIENQVNYKNTNNKMQRMPKNRRC